MAVLGLILLAAAGVLTAAVVTSNTGSLSVDLWGASVTNITLGVVFVAGMITTVLAVVGLGLLMGGLRRNRRLRQERRSLRRENQQLAQRVEVAPSAEDRRRDDDTQVMHDDRTLTHDDRPQAESDATHRAPAEPAQNDRATSAGTGSGDRSFLPPQEQRVHTDSGPRGT